MIFSIDNKTIIDNKFDYCSFAVASEHVKLDAYWSLTLDAEKHKSKSSDSRPLILPLS